MSERARIHITHPVAQHGVEAAVEGKVLGLLINSLHDLLPGSCQTPGGRGKRESIIYTKNMSNEPVKILRAFREQNVARIQPVLDGFQTF
jgi:hypothetical protein